MSSLELEFPAWTDSDTTWLRSFPACEVDLGCAGGHFLTACAAQAPRRCFIGVEWQAERARRTRRKIRRQALANARVFRAESLQFLFDFLPRQSVDVLHVLFPDPWPKRRHHRRRIIQPPFFAAAYGVVKPGGILRFLTDDSCYSSWTESLSRGQQGWEPLERDLVYPPTEFQSRFTAQGLPIYSTVLRRRESV